AVVPPFTLVHLLAARAAGSVIATNLASVAAAALLAWLATQLLGNPVQWISLGVGLYAAFSWCQALRLRDPPTYALVVGTPALRSAVLGFAFLAFTGYATGFWIAPFLIRVHGVSATRVGLILGGLSAVAGWLGATMGGLLADRLRQRSVIGRLQVGI